MAEPQSIKTVKIMLNDQDGSLGRAEMAKDLNCIVISKIRMESSNREPPHGMKLAVVNNGDGTVNITGQMPGKNPITISNLTVENGVLVVPDEAFPAV